MASATILAWVLSGEVALLAGILLIFLGHGAWLWLERKQSRPLLARGRRALLTVLEEGIPTVEREWLGTLAGRLQVRMFADVAPSLGGMQRQKLTALAHDIHLTAKAKTLCESRFWWRRLEGARLFTLLKAGESIVPLLFLDYHPIVRAQAAEWAADHPSAANIDSLLSLLSDANPLCRFTAQDSLLRMGSVVIEPLARYLFLHSGQQIEAALQVAAGLADLDFLAPALALCQDESPQVRTLAATLVGAVGGIVGVDALTTLLTDGCPEVRAAAAQALGKLHHWPAAARLASLLRDPTWIVRQAAGLALRALGAPGQLFLRRLCTDSDAYAMDMARQILDLPAEGEVVGLL
jgi:hypothetical protein